MMPHIASPVNVELHPESGLHLLTHLTFSGVGHEPGDVLEQCLTIWCPALQQLTWNTMMCLTPRLRARTSSASSHASCRLK